MKNLKEYITAIYGDSIYKKTLKLKEAKKDIAKTKNQFIFLQRCVKHKLIPKSLRIKCPVRNSRTTKIVKQYRFELLRSMKNDAKHRYFKCVEVAKDVHDGLSLLLSDEDMILVSDITEKAREAMFIRSKERLVKKFKILQGDNNLNRIERPKVYVKSPVLNLVPDEIPESHKDLLSLGPKFVPNTKVIPYMDIVSITESSALKLEYNKKVSEAQVLRKDVLKVLKTAKPVRDNLSRNQRTALNEMKNDQDISYYPYDKGAGLVRMKKDNGIEKIREQIGNTEIINEDPTDAFARDIRKTLSTLNKKGRFTPKEYESLYPSDAIPPRMYGTVKAHKPEKDYPMRIVVSTIGTPPYGISAYLVNVIQHTLDKNKSRLKNSRSFVNEAKSWKISPEEVQVSYDVVNLYPSVPLKEAIVVMLDILNNDVAEVKKHTKLVISEIKMLMEICLSQCYFLWNNEVHKLKDSGPIGLSLMVVMAEGFLQVLEAQAVNDALYLQPSIQPLSYYRYVDDIHSRFKSFVSADKFLDVLNNQHPKIKYTIDKENAKKELQFLDLKVINNGTGKYEFDNFRKNAITDVQIKPESSHDPQILRGVFKGFVHRALSVCSEKYITQEINYLVNVFVENGYKREDLKKLVHEVESKESRQRDISASTDNNIMQTITLPWLPVISTKLKKVYRKAGYKVVFKSGRNLCDMLTSANKTKLPKNSYPGVYKIPCACGITPYRGETKKKICTRTNEHRKNTEKQEWEKSAVALHSKVCSEDIIFDNAETVKVVYNKFDRKVREALEIQKYDCHHKDGGMNPDKGQYVTTKFWIPFFKYMRKSDELQSNRLLDYLRGNREITRDDATL